MPSSYTARARFTLQATGENTNIWGVILNQGAFDLVDFAINGVVTISASGATTLTTANGATDQARGAVLNYTGTTAGTLTIPSVEKVYQVRSATADLTVTNGSSSVTIPAGDSVTVITNGTTIWKLQANDRGGARLRNVGAPTANTDAATKKYVDETAFSMAAGSLPGQLGATGFLAPNVSGPGIAGWRDLTSSDVTVALGYTPADPSAIPVKATAAEVRAGTNDAKFLTPAALVDADGYVAVTANGAFTLDFSTGRKFKVTLTGNSTMSITGLTKEISGVIRFQQDATGSRTLGLNAAIKKFGSYTLSTAANAVDRCGVEICNGVVELTALEKGLA